MRTVRVVDYQEKLREEMPGVYVHEDFGSGGVTMRLDIRAHAAYAFLPLPDPDWDPPMPGQRDRVTEYLAAMVEQMRLRAIRELGLQPRLDAYEREARELRAANVTLSSQLTAAKAHVGELELDIRALRGDTEGAEG